MPHFFQHVTYSLPLLGFSVVMWACGTARVPSNQFFLGEGAQDRYFTLWSVSQGWFSFEEGRMIPPAIVILWHSVRGAGEHDSRFMSIVAFPHQAPRAIAGLFLRGQEWSKISQNISAVTK